MRFRIIHIMAFTAFVAIALMVYGFSQVAMWHGGAPLKISIVESPDHKIVGVGTLPLFSKDEANFILRDPEPHPSNFETVVWKSGQPFTTRIPINGTSTGIWELSYNQAPLVVLRLQIDDGSIEYKIVEVPDLRKQRSVTFAIEPRAESD